MRVPVHVAASALSLPVCDGRGLRPEPMAPQEHPERILLKKRLILILKLTVMVVVFLFVFYKLRGAWQTVGSHPIHIDWSFAPLIGLAFVGIMATNALTWRWLAWRMGDRNQTLPLLGAYTFSQAGKYAPGKVLLVLMRIERTHRLGMSRELCLLSTLVENAMYSLSGGLVGAIALMFIARDHPLYLVLCGLMIVGLLTLFHPKIFFGIVNAALKSMKRGPIPPSRHFRKFDMACAVLMFMPSWLFGGFGLWSAIHCVHGVSALEMFPLAGIFGLSVTLGMLSMFPGGLGVREAVQALFLMPIVHSAELIVVAVALPRVFQITVELTLAILGGIVSSRYGSPVSPPVAETGGSMAGSIPAATGPAAVVVPAASRPEPSAPISASSNSSD